MGGDAIPTSLVFWHALIGAGIFNLGFIVGRIRWRFKVRDRLRVLGQLKDFTKEGK